MSEKIEQSKILLESGTNELELMEFTISGEIFGINVAKERNHDGARSKDDAQFP